MKKNKFLTLIIVILPLFSFAQSAKDTGLSFINVLFQKQYTDAAAYIDDSLKEQITPQALQQAEEHITQQLGNYVNNIDVNEDEEEGYRVYYYYSKFENQNLDIKISLNQKDKIVGFFIVPHKEFDKKKQ